jgi:hypothetical protein
MRKAIRVPGQHGQGGFLVSKELSSSTKSRFWTAGQHVLESLAYARVCKNFLKRPSCCPAVQTGAA